METLRRQGLSFGAVAIRPRPLRRMAYEEGVTCGISSGAAVAVALRLAQTREFHDATIVVILPDSGERYLSTGLFKEIG